METWPAVTPRSPKCLHCRRRGLPLREAGARENAGPQSYTVLHEGVPPTFRVKDSTSAAAVCAVLQRADRPLEIAKEAGAQASFTSIVETDSATSNSKAERLLSQLHPGAHCLQALCGLTEFTVSQFTSGAWTSLRSQESLTCCSP